MNDFRGHCSVNVWWVCGDGDYMSCYCVCFDQISVLINRYFFGLIPSDLEDPILLDRVNRVYKIPI
jgi:hypothetical protein